MTILADTKKVLNLPPGYDVFDLDILMHINSGLSTLSQLDIGPMSGLSADESTEWSAIDLPANQLGLVKTYIFLKSRILFDPPGTSFHLNAAQEQIKETEWRLTVFRDEEKAEEAV